jgi:LuxR family maltose regulon positive regulatory protein
VRPDTPAVGAVVKLGVEAVNATQHALGDVAPVMGALVAAKLAPPRVRAGVVARPRLIDALAASGGAGVTVVCAPTGYGKTLLVAARCADLVERGAQAPASLSLAATENDPGLLMAYLI